MSSDFDFFKSYIGSLKIAQKDSLLELVKSNNYNASIYKFKMDTKNKIFLLSYNDNYIKTTQGVNILISNALNNPIYSLLFTNYYFNPKNFNDSLSALELFSDNIKQSLKYREIINLQTKETYKLTDNDIKFIQNSFGETYDNIVNDLLNNNMYVYSFLSAFLGIKINYWNYIPDGDNVNYKKLDVADYLHKKMGFNNLKTFNILDYFYNENGKMYFYTFFMTFKIEDTLRNFFISCE